VRIFIDNGGNITLFAPTTLNGIVQLSLDSIDFDIV
jgi:hypothetical protein